MKIIDIQIDGYGQYHQYHLEEDQLSSPLLFIYGPNEAGKSTLHAFIRGMLFGFHVKGKPAYEAFHGGQLGGSLTLLTAAGERIQIIRKAPPKNGKVQVILEDGREEDEDFLKALLGHMTPQLYSNIFAFSHQELQRIESLNEEEVSAYIYGASMGTGELNLLDFEKRMGRLQEQLFKPKAMNPELNAQLLQLEERAKGIMQLQRRLEEYSPLKSKQLELQDGLEQLKLKRVELEKKRRWIEERQRAVRLEEEIKVLQLEKERFAHTFHLLPFEPELQSLLLEKELIKEKDRELMKLNDQQKGMESNITHHLKELGEEWSEERLSHFALSIEKKDTLLQLAEKKEQKAMELNQLQSERKRRDRSLPIFIFYSVLTIVLPPVLYRFEQQIAALIFLVFFLALAIKEGITYSQARVLESDIKKREKEWYRLDAAWANELDLAGLPSLQSMEAYQLFIRKLEETQFLLRHYEEIRNRKEQISKQIFTWEDRVHRIVEQLGELYITSGSVFSLIEILHYDLQIEKEAQNKKHELERQLRRLQLEYEQLLSDPLEKLTQEELDDMQHRNEQEIQRVLEDIEGVSKAIGTLSSEIKQLETESSLSKLIQEFEEQKTNYNQTAKNWSVYTLAKYLSERTRKVFEEQKQPSILKTAGSYLQKLTLGRYVQIIIPIGQRNLIVVREDGERLGAQQLSQGTLEQLYLAMRLAFIKEQSLKVPLPILMDDIFVNFDHSRLQSALEVIQEISATNQIIHFTCHQYLLEAIKYHVHSYKLIQLEGKRIQMTK